MAKYTIISLILTDCVPIFVIFNLFEIILGGHSASKKSQVQKSPNPARGGGGGGGGGHLHFGPIPKIPRFFDWKASLSSTLFEWQASGSAKLSSSNIRFKLPLLRSRPPQILALA